MAATYTSNFSSLLAPGLHKVYGLEYNEHPEEYTQLFDIMNSKRNYEDQQEIGGFGLVPEKPEGQSITYDEAGEGYSKRYTHVTYGMGFIVTREMHEDDLYNKIMAMPKALAKSVRHSIEILGQNIYNNGFTSGTGGDGVVLFSASHTTRNGGNYSNLLTAASLSETSLEAALVANQTNFIDNQGLKMPAKATKLVIHPANEWTAKKLLNSVQEPETANNAINPGKGAIGSVVMGHWLTSTTAWFVRNDIPNGLQFFWRRKPEFGKDNDFDSENAKFKTTFRCSVGWTDPRSILGNAGA